MIKGAKWEINVNDDAEKPVAAVTRALAILDAFPRTGEALSLNELAQRTGLNKSTILRLVVTLEQFGYTERDARGDYRIGPKPLTLGMIYQRSAQPAELILPKLERLASRTGESAAFFVRFEQTSRICLYRIDSNHSVREHLRPGDVLPLNRGAAGRILSAFSRPAAASLAATRRELVAITTAEVTPDVRTAAAPVFDVTSLIAGSVTVSGPEYRFTEQAVKKALPELLTTAQELTLGLGGDGTIFNRLLETHTRPKRPRTKTHSSK